MKSSADAEAVVVRQLPGKGRLAGMMWALLVELADGTRFRIGTGFSDAERRNPPAPGTVITFPYRGTYASGIPKFPSFLRVRADAGLEGEDGRPMTRDFGPGTLDSSEKGGGRCAKPRYLCR